MKVLVKNMQSSFCFLYFGVHVFYLTVHLLAFDVNYTLVGRLRPRKGFPTVFQINRRLFCQGVTLNVMNDCSTSFKFLGSVRFLNVFQKKSYVLLC